MSDTKKKLMDPRCPRKLKNLPCTWCPLAVLRLKSLRNAGKELSEEEENKLPGCQWALNHQLANYCFFKYISDYLPDDRQVTDNEIAHLLNISVDSVKKISKKALEKMRTSEGLREILESKGSDPILDNKNDSESYSVIK